MASHRATSHVSYNKFFAPMMDAFRKAKEEQRALDKLVISLPKGKAVETRARFYTWRKLLTKWCTVNAAIATQEEMERMAVAEGITVKAHAESEITWRLEFTQGEAAEFLKLLEAQNDVKLEDHTETIVQATQVHPQAAPVDAVAIIQAELARRNAGQEA